MSDVVIKIENIWKEYRLGVVTHHSMRLDLQSWWARVRGKEDPNARVGSTSGKASKSSQPPSPRPPTTSSLEASLPEDRFWALQDISFEVNRGDIVGIIGRNGAGKSTLLKILSNVTTPTRGQVSYKGRIASLLEVGTGFHPELTGRENIFINGAILGMIKIEIKRKFDEIVDFSGVEKFIDTPVKRYSSGMYVRLAFAVAAHLEPEILIIDEVLAVGDAEFQKKCLGKMEDVSKEGRTIIFVSHNMGAVNSLCGSGILLRNGSIECNGSVSQVVSEYLSGNTMVDSASIDLTGITKRKGNGILKFKSISLYNNGKLSNKYSIGDDITISFVVEATEPVKNVKFAFQLFASDGFAIANIIDCDSGFKVDMVYGKVKLSVILKDIRFYPDQYHIGLWAGGIESIDQYDYLETCANFEIVDGGKLTSRTLPRTAGLLFLTPEWKKTGMQ